MPRHQVRDSQLRSAAFLQETKLAAAVGPLSSDRHALPPEPPCPIVSITPIVDTIIVSITVAPMLAALASTCPGGPRRRRTFDLLKVANVDAVKFLQKQGVKEIEIRAALFEATAHYHRRKSKTQRLLGGVARQAKAIFGSEHDVTNDALKITLKVTRDGRGGKSLKLGGKRIVELATDLVEHQEGGDDFYILTNGGQKIGPKEIFMRSKAFIEGEVDPILRTTVAGFLVGISAVPIF